MRAFLCLALAACAIPASDFHASIDGGTMLQATSGIIVSSQAIELDEGGTASFTVHLGEPPASPIELALSTASAKLGLSSQALLFDATNFAADQTVTVSGFVDDDTVNELADVTIEGGGLAAVKVGATVRDPDKVDLVTDQLGDFVVGEATAKTVHLHLSHRPTADTIVTASLTTGPMTVAPAMRVIHPEDFATDVDFTITAPPDQDTGDDLQTLTFAFDGGTPRSFAVTDDDRDSLAIQATPGVIDHLLEGNSATINVTLSLRPPAGGVTVKVETTTGQLTLDTQTVTFLGTGTDYLTPKPVKVTAIHDGDTAPGADTVKLSIMDQPGVNPVTIAVHIDDSDVQQIQTTVVNTLQVDERASQSFGVSLKFAPVSPLTVSLASLDPAVATAASATGANFLTFTAADFNDAAAHQVIVRGTGDANLVTNSTVVRLAAGTLQSDVQVDVRDVDRQAIVITPGTPLTIAEGGTGTFTVALAFQPTAAVRVNLASTNPDAVPIVPAMPTIDFTTTNWQMPVTVTLRPPADRNDVGETATIAITSPPIPAASVSVTVMDNTQIDHPGWPTPFGQTTSLRRNAVIAYKVHIAASTLDSFGIYVPNASSSFRMALYRDAGNLPGALVGTPAQQFPVTALVNGITLVDIPDVALTAGDYWIAVRVDASTSIGSSTTTGRRCTSDFDIDALANPWPATFDSPTCTDANLLNLWTTTYH
jgi:hypothetical protein